MTSLLQGAFVTLRELTVDDAERTLSWRLDGRAKLLNPGAVTVEQQAAWIAARPESEVNFVIELVSGEPVGMLSLVGIDLVNRRAEPARFLIGEPDLVRGIPAAVEAMRLLYLFAFEELHLHRVHGTVVSENRLMIKWQKYLGMREEGVLREHYAFEGVPHDAVVMGMLEDEYRAVTVPRMRALIGRSPTVATKREGS